MISCATPDVVSRIEQRDVAVPIHVACVEAKDVEELPPSAMRPEGDVAALAAGAAVDLKTLRRFAQRQQALLRACAVADQTKGGK